MLDQATRLRELVQPDRSTTVTTEIISTKSPEISDGCILAVTSGKGGVGKTNCVINLALLLAKCHKKVAIVDLDLGLANVDILLNMTPRFTIHDVISGKKTIEDILVEGPRGVMLVPGGSGIPALADLDTQERHNVIQAFLALKQRFDYVILDTAAGISKNVIDFVLIADDIIVITTPEPTAITDAYAVIKIIASHNRETPIHMLFNMVRDQHEATSYFNKVNQVIRQFLHITVQHLGYIIHDTCVHQAIMKRKPFALAYPFSYATRSLYLVARTIMKGTDEKKRSEHQSLIEKIKHVFK